MSTTATATQARSLTAALLVICGAQMLIVLDSTIVNVALPAMQTSLDLTSAGLSWVINAYTLVFGGFLLLGGRVGDLIGRRRAFMLGIAIFTIASLAAGLAQTEWQLLIARGIQGAGGALASPAALALIATMFSEGRERNRALGIYSAVSGAAAAIGLILGGVLTELLDWRWVFFVNVPLGAVLIFLAPRVLAESTRERGRLDILGAATVTAGVISLVYGTINAAENGWDEPLTIGSFIAAGVLLVSFVIVERFTAQPLLPLRILRDRNRAGAYAAQAVVSGAFFSSLFFASMFLQRALELTPLWAGLASLPIALVIG
ncbi:MAG TPA: MFS transporter, partial [Microbacteriaceae bacterium]|nr:MFS transporter [Microbacteriaceae bacterium]